MLLLLLGGDERGVGIVIGIEGLVDSLSAFFEAGLAGDLDRDPAQDHGRYGDHCACDCCHFFPLVIPFFAGIDVTFSLTSDPFLCWPYGACTVNTDAK
ncbi:uncharacterized protein A4U43_C07F34140 [Asparagus officinalis]|uniref:Uncharacterized protein n=1 Tax=Asparagus officinalis TaxID=4686 RepID=A0A5P1EH81_ASPOF|nr:uncharacterized protein A4U43_C07F34140 [Asparagus officinalis]